MAAVLRERSAQRGAFLTGPGAYSSDSPHLRRARHNPRLRGRIIGQRGAFDNMREAIASRETESRCRGYRLLLLRYSLKQRATPLISPAP
jgi:hypothetical protein